MDNEGLEKSLHRLKIEQQTDRSLIRILEVVYRDLKKDYSNLEDAFVSLAHRLDKRNDLFEGEIRQLWGYTVQHREMIETLMHKKKKWWQLW